jgi:flagellar protein FlaI
VTIEDTQELNLPHENWIPAVSRQAFTDGKLGEITQFDLLRAALRQRPDIIVVGETRGREAHTLFQAMATGHGGFSSIHADSVNATITRLISTPMEVPKVLIINTLDAILLQLKLKLGDRSVRRVIQLSEIAGMDENSGEILLNDVFTWNPGTDKHTFSGRSVVFEKISARYGLSHEQITYELNKRKTALEWMVENDIHKHKEVNETIMEFYANPERFYERKRYLV